MHWWNVRTSRVIIKGGWPDIFNIWLDNVQWLTGISSTVYGRRYEAQQLTHSLKASRLISGTGSFISGISEIIFWEHSSNSLCEGLSLPMLACNITSEFLITSFSAFWPSLGVPAFLHPFTELGTTNLRPFANISKFVLSGILFNDDAKVSLSFGRA